MIWLIKSWRIICGGGTCGYGMYGEEEKSIQGLWYEYLKERACLEELDVDDRTILKRILNVMG
jgi:hypothetical protein